MLNKLKKLGLNNVMSALLMTIYIVTYIVDALTIKKITFLDFFMCTATLLFLFLVFRKAESIYYVPAIIFAFFALFFGSMLDFYSIIPIYDLLLHAASGILLTFAGHWLYTQLTRKKTVVIPLIIPVFFAVFFSMAAAGVWEIWEFSGDSLFGLTSQGSGQFGLNDTMTDIIAGCASGVVGGAILYLLLSRRAKK